MEGTANDWIILRRPRADGGNLAYFATARVDEIASDPNEAGMFYARIENLMQFDKQVPWRSNGRYEEEALRSIPQSQVGVYLRGRSVRPMTDGDFVSVISKGLGDSFDISNGMILDRSSESSLAAGPSIADETVSVAERVRIVETSLVSRVVRDANFRRAVVSAYDARCAISGIHILDNSGNPEVHAAHIWPVAENSPDIVQNGLALSATVHWMFDRHLISVDEDFGVLFANESVAEAMKPFFGNADRKLNLPSDTSKWPHRPFLHRHRKIFRSLARSDARKNGEI